MQLYLTRSVTGLSAADDEAVTCLRRIKVGQVVRADVVVPRNLRHHRKFFALLNLVWAATDQWESVEDLLIELKVRLGVVRDVVLRESGEVVKVIGSISFGSMDQAEFDAFFEKSLRLLAHMAGGIESDVLRREVLNNLAEA
jgi:hypothetical protein